MHKTNYLIELGHMRKHRELFTGFKDLFVLRTMGLICERVYVMFLSDFPSQPGPK